MSVDPSMGLPLGWTDVGGNYYDASGNPVAVNDINPQTPAGAYSAAPWDTAGSYAANAAANASGAPAPAMTPNGPAPSTAPTLNSALASGYNPLQPQYLPQPGTLNATTVNPSYANAGTYNAQTLSPQLMQSLGAGNTINSLVAANQPQFQQQDQQMMQMLATAGLAPSSTAGGTAFNNLAQQQLAGMDPSIAAAIQNSQANQLNAGQFNTGQLNNAGQYNAGNIQNNNQFNATTGNTANTYNANALNTAAQQNLANQLAQQSYNTNAYNTAGNTYFNALTGDYNNQENAYNALNSAGLSGASNLASGQQSGGNSFANTAQTQYPVYNSGNAYSNLGSAIGSAGAYNYPTPTPGANAGYNDYGAIDTSSA